MAWSKPSKVSTSKPNKLIKDMIVFYGDPHAINNAYDVQKAVEIYGKYDIVIFGDLYQLPEHDQYDKTSAIISTLRQKRPNQEIFGYVPVGVAPEGEGHDIPTIKSLIDDWKALKVTGIFLDEFGYDYRVDRERQNEIVNYCHEKGLRVMVNAWQIDHVFSKRNVIVSETGFEGNPNNIPPALNENDYFMFENLFFFSENGIVQQGSSQWRLYDAVRYFQEEQDDYGGKSYYEQFKTKIVALDAIITKNPTLFTIGYLGSVLLRLHGYGASIYNWGSSSNDYNHYETPELKITDGDEIGTIDAKNFSGLPYALYENTLGKNRLKLIWRPDDNNYDDLTQGVHQIFINDEPVNYRSGDRRPYTAPIGYQFFDTNLGKPIWFTGTNWVDASGTPV